MERSCFNQSVVQYAFRVAAAVDFSHVPPALKSIVQDCFCSIGQTKVIEDTFHDQRNAECRSQPNKTVSHRRKFQICVTSDVLSSKHNFEQILQRVHRALEPEDPAPETYLS